MEETVWVNPVITDFSDSKGIEEEGCLSFPSMQGLGERIVSLRLTRRAGNATNMFAIRLPRTAFNQTRHMRLVSRCVNV